MTVHVPEIIPNDSLQRALPNSAEAERAILGAILLDNSMITQAVEQLKPEDFYVPSHRRIFIAMSALFQRGSEIGPILIGEELKKENALESVGGIAFITNLTYGLPHSSNISHYAKVVAGKSYLRKLIKASNAITQEALAEEDEPETIGEHAEQRIFALKDARTSRGKFEGVKPIAEGVLELIQEQSGRGAVVSGLTTGFHDLDRLTSGLQKPNLIIVAARPSTGKTSFALMLAQNAAILTNAVVGYFALEGSKRSLVTRMLAQQGNIDANRLRNGFLSRLEWAQIAKALGVLSETKISFDDTPGMTILEMRAKAMRLADEQKKLDLIIVDHVQLMRGRKPSYQSENLMLTEISNDLVALSKELNVPLVVLSQMSRKSEDRSDHTPQLSDLRGSGCLTGDARITMATGERRTINEIRDSHPTVLAQRDGIPGDYDCSNVFGTGRRPVFLLQTTMGREIKATENHQFWTDRRWQRLDSLKTGDVLPVMVPPNISGGDPLSQNEIILLAHLIGNGCLLPRHSAQYTTRHRDLADLVADTSRAFFGSEIDPVVKYDNPRQQEGWFNVFFRSTRRHTHGVHSAVTDWANGFSLFGLRSPEKFVPEAIFRQTNAVIGEFLSHLWSTDGTIGMHHGQRNSPGIAFSSSSRRLVNDVQFLLLRLSILSSIDTLKTEKYRWQFLQVVGGSDQIDRFVSTVKPVGRYQTGRAAEISDCLLTRSRGKVAYAEVNGWVEDRVERIAPAGLEDCFDLTVPGADCFQANGLIVHNSLEQDADVVAFLHRPEKYMSQSQRENLPEEDKNLCEVIVAKQREGPTDVVNLRWTPSSMRFDNLYRGTEETLPYAQERGEVSPLIDFNDD